MRLELKAPRVEDLDDVVAALRGWQDERTSTQLHPGDLGWNWRFGVDVVLAGLRVWRGDDEVVAVGMMDDAALMRLALAPAYVEDESLARRMVDDLNDPSSRGLPGGLTSVEVRVPGLLRRRLVDAGWTWGVAMTPLRRDLTTTVEEGGLRVEVVGPEEAPLRAALQRAAFDGSTFSEARWYAMAAGPPYADGRCLIGYADDVPVATATVWSAGPGRPGLLEPVGVHREHRGHGYGTAIGLAAAAALRELGSSDAFVCTHSDNPRAVATYRSAGFVELPQEFDLARR